jgi:hypothetical protein
MLPSEQVRSPRYRLKHGSKRVDLPVGKAIKEKDMERSRDH